MPAGPGLDGLGLGLGVMPAGPGLDGLGLGLGVMPAGPGLDARRRPGLRHVSSTCAPHS